MDEHSVVSYLFKGRTLGKLLDSSRHDCLRPLLAPCVWAQRIKFFGFKAARCALACAGEKQGASTCWFMQRC